jgi:hypothetical protein
MTNSSAALTSLFIVINEVSVHLDELKEGT